MTTMKSYWMNKKEKFQIDKEHIERHLKNTTDQEEIDHLIKQKQNIAKELEIACLAVGSFN